MIRLSACIEMLFREHDFYDRPAAAKAAGLAAFEFWGWSGKDLGRLAAASKLLPVAACCVDTRDASRREAIRRSGLLDEANAPIFCENVEETCEAVAPLGVRTLIVTVGQALPIPRERQCDAIASCLRAAAKVAEQCGVTLVVEPLNALVDHKGYFLTSSAEGFDILRAVGSPNVKLLFDLYHQQISEGNLIASLTANLSLIGHFHAADNPGRNQPGTGEIAYRNVLRAIAGGGYDGYVGLEYAPTEGTATEASLRPILADAASA